MVSMIIFPGLFLFVEIKLCPVPVAAQRQARCCPTTSLKLRIKVPGNSVSTASGNLPDDKVFDSATGRIF
jgi:hypothetical protein